MIVTARSIALWSGSVVPVVEGSRWIEAVDLCFRVDLFRVDKGWWQFTWNGHHGELQR